jgi:hypothetical protein
MIFLSYDDPQLHEVQDTASALAWVGIPVVVDQVGTGGPVVVALQEVWLTWGLQDEDENIAEA